MPLWSLRVSLLFAQQVFVSRQVAHLDAHCFAHQVNHSRHIQDVTMSRALSESDISLIISAFQKASVKCNETGFNLQFKDYAELLQFTKTEYAIKPYSTEARVVYKFPFGLNQCLDQHAGTGWSFSAWMECMPLGCLADPEYLQGIRLMQQSIDLPAEYQVDMTDTLLLCCQV